MAKKGNTFLSECRKFFPKCTQAEAVALVWGATAFPFAGIERCREQLREASRASGRDPLKALAWAENEMLSVIRRATQ